MEANGPNITSYAERRAALRREAAVLKKSAHKKDYWGETPLFGVARAGNRRKCQILLKIVAADPNVRNNDGQTALMWSNTWGQGEKGRDTTSVLIAAGADPNIRDNDGNTALMMALARRNTDKARILLEAGADVNIVGKNNKTALMLACTDEIASMMIEAMGP